MLWIIFGIMLIVALCAVLWPLWRSEDGLSVRALGVAAALVAVAAITYGAVGQPDARFAAAGAAAESVEDMVASLAERLESNPEDVEGWKMLGRSYTVMRRFDEAVSALERAAELEDNSNGQTLADLGEAVFLSDNTSLNGRAGQLFENALALSPGNPKGLFYSGLAAADRGDNAQAAERWEALLATSPPPEIENVLRQRIAEWRGEPATPGTPATAEARNESAINVDLALGEAAASLDPKTTVFIIARDPAQPAPPIAVARRLVEELPTSVTLTDADAMLPGRPLSAFNRVQVVARASPSGQPLAQSGDWFAETEIEVASKEGISLTLDQQVP